MTVDQMHPMTLSELASLEETTKAELLALAANRMMVVFWRLENVARGQSVDPGEDARIALKSAREFLAELKELLCASS